MMNALPGSMLLSALDCYEGGSNQALHSEDSV